MLLTSVPFVAGVPGVGDAPQDGAPSVGLCSASTLVAPFSFAAAFSVAFLAMAFLLWPVVPARAAAGPPEAAIAERRPGGCSGMCIIAPGFDIIAPACMTNH